MFICQHIATPPVLQCVKYDLHMRVYRSANSNVSFAPERGYTGKGRKDYNYYSSIGIILTWLSIIIYIYLSHYASGVLYEMRLRVLNDGFIRTRMHITLKRLEWQSYNLTRNNIVVVILVWKASKVSESRKDQKKLNSVDKGPMKG